MEDGMPKVFPLAVFVACFSGSALAADVTGDWLVDDKSTVIRVQPCGSGMCGYIAWGKGPAGGTDKNNPDPAKRNRPLLGMQIINMKAASAANRYEGEIYNAKDGKIYSGSIALVNEKTLRIEGCVLGFLCGGENWARAKCDEAPPPAGAQTGAPPAGGARPSPPPSGARPSPAAASSPIPTLTACRVGP
jgi:uncharacterized protein (DUF2147 family)